MSAGNTFIARHYRTGETLSVTIAEGRYAALAPHADKGNAAELPVLAPGLVDLQVNGFAGVDFNRSEGLSPEAWDRACRALLVHGCTAFQATLITHGAAETEALLALLGERIAENPRNCVGIHLEGPFLNPDAGTRGAHDPAKMIPFGQESEALFARWQKAARGRIARITLAPEVDPATALPFIQRRVSEGVRISIGHSLAMGEILREAVAAGASCWTHLGNAAPRLADKFENVFLHALAQGDSFSASMVPDGLHVPPHAFRALARALGPRLHLTTDAMAGAGLPVPKPGETATATLGYQNVALDASGRAVLPGTEKLAGSTLVPLLAPFLAAGMSGLPWEECWEAFSVRPSAWAGLAHDLAVGNPADAVLLRFRPDGGIAPAAVLLRGTPVEAGWPGAVQRLVPAGEEVFR